MITSPQIITRRSWPVRRLVVAAVFAAAIVLTLGWLRVVEAARFEHGIDGEALPVSRAPLRPDAARAAS